MKIRIKVEEKLFNRFSYDIEIPEGVTDHEVNIVIARVESVAQDTDDVIHLLRKEIPGLKVINREDDGTNPEVESCEITEYDRLD